MSNSSPPGGKRERNKVDKGRRIAAASRALFATHDVDDVTLEQIAQRARVAKGTLSLYAGSKTDLFLQAQNDDYARAVERGIRRAAEVADPVEAIEAIVRELVACSRRHPRNGRAYLRALVFGAVDERNRVRAQEIAAGADAAIAALLQHAGAPSADAQVGAGLISQSLLLTLATSENAGATPHELIAAVRPTVALVARAATDGRPPHAA